MRNFILAGVMLALAAPTAHSAVFQDDFSRGLSSTYWYVTTRTPDMYSVDASQGDVRLAKIAPTPGGYQDVEINLDLASLVPGGEIAGDFDIQVDFRDAVIVGPGLNQVELHTGYKNGAIFYDVRDGSNVHVWNGATQGWIATTATAGRFRIKRVGSTVSGSFNDQLIWSSSSYSSPLVWVAFSLQNNNGSNDPISVTFDDFSISAEGFYPETASPKLLEDGQPLSLNGWLATSAAGDFPGLFYVEAADRHQGIRVSAPAGVMQGVTRGSVADVSGVMSTTPAGERQIEAWTVSASLSASEVRPLGMTGRSLGGSDFGAPPLGQYGVAGGWGLNNVGLLVRLCGRVRYSGGQVLLDDGSGVETRLDVSQLTKQPVEGSFLLVTGISTLGESGAGRVRVVLPREQADILTL